MACNVADFRLLFPEFSDETEYPDERIELFFTQAEMYIGGENNAGRWCGNYCNAKYYLTAHLLTIATKSEAGDSSQSAAGAITSRKADGVSVTYATGDSSNKSSTDSFYGSTSYGQQFLAIRARCFAGVAVAS